MKYLKLTNNQFMHISARLVTSATLVATLAFAPGLTFAVTAADKDVHEDRTELRIKDMHTKLKITPTQEEQWAKVTQTMLDDAKIMDALTQARVDHAEDRNAIDDLKSYGEIVEAHADGIKKLTPVFADLYASMSDVQKKEADTFFRKGDHKNSDKKSVGK
ncbi:Spy/CpxP family protein refolding chaperone [Methylobacter sp. S3L5C]|uniref:Spy/CpxP family protein refolding chaperone n=1 Tax=Methylobacter sp. S3L5C TaxID=2839024 RepID=UPI001FADE736|nr:Spy/CpxP family protein refolding chaperone [Methylobacter sp. S3L5C]UOA07981.1 Spy/CpxP family protein refolding chaperone [Methylobacter sp. S3L5C]